MRSTLSIAVLATVLFAADRTRAQDEPDDGAGSGMPPLPGGYELGELAPFSRVEVGGGVPLRLDDVLQSTLRAHPTLDGARERVRAAEGERLAAEGGFDLNIAAGARAAPLGYYEWARGGLQLTQPTPLWGTTLYGGWRIGRPFQNDDAPGIPLYYRGYETLDGGELHAGVRVPLWRDGPIDARRARLWQSEHGVDAEAHALRARRLEVSLAASEAYFAWVAAGRRYLVAAELLDLAEMRDAQIRARASAGAIPPIEAVENRRVIIARRQELVQARRALEQAAIRVSLYVRDGEGRPIVPAAARVPLDLPPPEPLRVSIERAVRDAWEQRPEVARYRALVRRQSVAVDLANNRLAPQIDLILEASTDLGAGNERQQSSLGAPVIEGSVLVSLPLQFREARGDLARTRAELEVLRTEARLARDTITTQVRDARSAVHAAEEALELARESVRVAEAVAEAERRRFELGATELFVVNLREQAAAAAAAALVDAEAALHVAHARWRAAIGAPAAPGE